MRCRPIPRRLLRESAIAETKPTATTTPAVASSTPEPTAFAAPTGEPEVRRAEPVHPEDLAKVGLQTSPGAQLPAGAKRLEVRPVRKTFVRVVVEKNGHRQPFEEWIAPGDKPLFFEGQHFTVHALERDSVELRKNGKRVSDDDADITIE